MKKLFTMMFCLLLLQGCSARYSVNVDSLNDSSMGSKTQYILLPYNSDINSNDLKYREFANYVHKVLVQRGFQAVKYENANLIIFLEYAIGEPKTSQHTYSVPTWGQTGVASTSTYGTFSQNGNTTTYSGTTLNTPSYGITGSTTHTRTSTNYTRSFKLSAFDLEDFKISGELKPVWYTSAVSTGSSGDLRSVFPVMLAASSEYISENTSGYKHVSIRETDQRVKDIKGIK